MALPLPVVASAGSKRGVREVNSLVSSTLLPGVPLAGNSQVPSGSAMVSARKNCPGSDHAFVVCLHTNQKAAHTMHVAAAAALSSQIK